MNGKRIILVIIIASLSFNGIFIVGQNLTESNDIRWLFPEIGPAVIQDSNLGRAPSIESPFGIIGDLPGLYPIYDGNPLQYVSAIEPHQFPNTEIVILAVMFSIIPFSIVVILGRRSYGASKTQ